MSGAALAIVLPFQQRHRPQPALQHPQCLHWWPLPEQLIPKLKSVAATYSGECEGQQLACSEIFAENMHAATLLHITATGAKAQCELQPLQISHNAHKC